MYYLIFILILVFSIREIYTGKTNKPAFYAVYFSLVFVTVFRFGQGWDYFAYAYLYGAGFITDPGFDLLTMALSNIGVPYILFSAFFGFITMLLFYPFFAKTCQKSMIPLMLFYAYVFFIYPTSGIRQGFTLALLLGVLYPLLVQKKYIAYYIILLLGCTFHQSLFICAFMPFIIKLTPSKQRLWSLFIIFTLLMFLGQSLGHMAGLLSERIAIYLSQDESFSLTSVIIRIAIMAIILSIPEKYLTDRSVKMRNLIFCGYAFYALLSVNSLVAARLEVYYRIFEGAFLFMLLKDNLQSKLIKQYAMVFIFIYTIIWFKNLGAIASDIFVDGINMFNYPFTSVFNINEAMDLILFDRE